MKENNFLSYVQATDYYSGKEEYEVFDNQSKKWKTCNKKVEDCASIEDILKTIQAPTKNDIAP